MERKCKADLKVSDTKEEVRGNAAVRELGGGGG